MQQPLRASANFGGASQLLSLIAYESRHLDWSCAGPLQVVSWAGSSPDGKAVLGDPAVLAPLFDPHLKPEGYAECHFNLTSPQGKGG